jgi:hypothetical protein
MTQKFDRRSLFRFMNYSIVALPLLRLLQAERVDGAALRKKLCVITHPEGHDAAKFAQTRAAILGTALEKRALFINNVRLQSNGITHGSEQSILRANTQASLDSLLERNHGMRALRLGLAINPSNPSSVLCHNEQGAAGRIVMDPAAAFKEVFGQTLQLMNGYQLTDLKSGRKGILDHCLDDVRALKGRLGGSMAATYDDYIYSVNELYKQIQGLPGNATAGSPAAGGPPVAAAQCTRMDPSVVLSGAVEANFDAYVEAMLGVAFQALACDAVQTVVLQFAHSESGMAYNFPKGPVTDSTGFHGAVIHGQGKSPTYQAVIQWYFAKVASFATRFMQGPDDLLASTAILHTSNGGDCQAHSLDNTPMTIYGELGGTFKTGQTIAAPAGSTHFQILRQLLDGLVGPEVAFGDAKTRIAGL